MIEASKPAFCAHTVLQEELMVVDNVLDDRRFFDNSLVANDPQIRFYAGRPLASHDGFKLGTLCALDRRPYTLEPFRERALQTLGRQVEAQLHLRYRTLDLERVNKQEEALHSLVVHDLKAPIACVLLSAQYLTSSGVLDGDERSAADDIELSAIDMNSLVTSLLDVHRSE